MNPIRFFNTIILFFSISILIAQDPPPNNTYQTAIELSVQPGSCSSQTQGDLTHATNSNGSDYSSECFDDSYGRVAYGDVWYKAILPSSGKLDVTITNTLNRFPFLMVVYTESEGILTEVQCATTDSFRATALENTEVFLMVVDRNEVEGYSRSASTFTICAYDPDGTLDFPQTPKPLLSYYSNPVGNRLSVESPYQIETLRVFDLMGKEVLHKTPQQQKLTLDTFTLAPGAYLLQVETPEGEQTVKLIKK